MVKNSKEENVMRNIQIDKLVINCCVGEPGDKLTKATKVLKDLSGQEPVLNQAKITIRSFSIRRGDKIAAHVSIRGDKAKDILERGLKVKDFQLKKDSFSNNGTFGFGIQEHIDLGLRYDPYTGIFGMDFFVVLKRPGARVARRKHGKGKVGNNQTISKEEAQEWFKRTYDGTLI